MTAPPSSRAIAWLAPVVALALTAAVGALLFALLGRDPVSGLRLFLVEPLSGPRAIGEVVLKSTPLVLCAVGLSLCFRANVWNVGAEGQFLLGAIAGGGLALWAGDGLAGLGPWGFLPLGIAAGAIGGAAWAAVVALLRDRFGASEILVGLMLAYVADLLLAWLVFGPWRDPQGFNFPHTASFAPSTSPPRLAEGTRAHWGAAVALAAALAAWVYLERRLGGLRLQVAGLAPAAAGYAGFSARRVLWTVLPVSGALAGVAGALEATGPIGQLNPHVSTGYGFTAIVVAFVGRLHPLGCVPAAVLLSTFVIGGELAQSRMGLPAALGGIFQGVLLCSLLACDALAERWAARRARGPGAMAGAGR
jgi:ABC-type uncharacterized transport system permease subunit